MQGIPVIARMLRVQVNFRTNNTIWSAATSEARAGGGTRASRSVTSVTVSTWVGGRGGRGGRGRGRGRRGGRGRRQAQLRGAARAVARQRHAVHRLHLFSVQPHASLRVTAILERNMPLASALPLLSVIATLIYRRSLSELRCQSDITFHR